MNILNEYTIPVVKALSNGKVGPRQRTLPTYLPKVDVPRPSPPTYVGAAQLGAQRPNGRGGGGPTSAPNVPTSGGNVQRQRGQSTSLDTDAHAPHSASELAPAAGWAALGTAPGGVNSRTEQ